MRPPARKPTVHQMKVTLKGVKPPIWRRVVIPSGYHLDEVAVLLLAAMGWTNSHLHCFVIGDRRYNVVGDWAEGDEVDEAGVSLRSVFDAVGSTMRFEYDFGDGWEHDVLLEAIRIQTKAESKPACLAGKRACPPEDCGGPYGYESLMELVREGATSEWDREQLEWLGDFDPARFDPGESTGAMQWFLVEDS